MAAIAADITLKAIQKKKSQGERRMRVERDAGLPGPQSSRNRTSQFCIDKAFKHEFNHIGTQLIGSVEAECESTSFDRSGN